MKKLFFATIAVALFMTVNLSAQTTQSTQNAQTKEQTITNSTQQQNSVNNAQPFYGNKFQNRQNNLNPRNEVCDGTHKRLHKQSYNNQCDGSGRKYNRRGRR